MEPFETKEDISAKILNKMRTLGLNQVEFARKLGMKPQQLNRYVAGITRPRDETLRAILNYGQPFSEPVKEERPPDYQMKTTRAQAHKDLDEIFDAEGQNPDIVNALLANLRAFRGKVRPPFERRKSLRFLMTIPVSVRLLDTPEAHRAVALDASQAGVLIQSSRDLSIGDRMKIEMSFIKNDAVQTFKAEVEIRWKKKKQVDEAEAFQYGAKFTEVLDQGLGKLESLLEGGE